MNLPGAAVLVVSFVMAGVLRCYDKRIMPEMAACHPLSPTVLRNISPQAMGFARGSIEN
jgi:hypothetical protein